jgi:UDP-2,3-diacylglucosamine pyrophosphatase LpxH
MLNHQDILEKLRSAFPGERGVTLVARYADDALKLPTRRAHVFIGDCHMLNNEDTQAYPKYQFLQSEDLRTLLKALTELKAAGPGQLRVWHLGDLFDIWRARGGIGPAAEVDKITHDHHEIVDYLREGPPGGVRARIIAGNHDYALYELGEWRADRYRIVDNDAPDGGDILVLHGDVFSWIEKLPDERQARAVRFATWHAAGTKVLSNNEEPIIAEINRGLNRDTPFGEGEVLLASARPTDLAAAPPEPINVIDGDAGDPDADNKKNFAGAKELAKAMRERGHNIRLMITGHAHYARLVQGAIGDTRFVLMDCGAWIGYVRLSKDEDRIHSGQIGVMVGNELRLYQIGWRLVS